MLSKPLREALEKLAAELRETAAGEADGDLEAVQEAQGYAVLLDRCLQDVGTEEYVLTWEEFAERLFPRRDAGFGGPRSTLARPTKEVA